jgi:hypothetical protein
MLNDQEPRNGRPAKQYPEREAALVMTVYTRAPEKWLLVDRETGEVYQGNEVGSWDRIIPDPGITDEERLKNVKRIQHR